jgi:hypothetical protein
MGYSLVLEDVFSHLLEHDKGLEEWIFRWKELISSSLVREIEKPTACEAFDSENNRSLFPELIAALTPESGSEHRSVLKIYRSIEWALYYCCEIHDPTVALARLRQSNYSNYAEEMRLKVQSIGFEVPSGYRFEPISLGKILDFENNKAEMETVLAVSLLQTDSNRLHPLFEIASVYPDLFTTLREVSRLRGERGHGNSLAVSNEHNPLFEEVLRKVVSLLLPEIQFDERGTEVDKDVVMRRRFRARASLHQALGGYEVMNRLGPGVQSVLVDAEKFWLEGNDDDDACEFVSHIYSGLQGVVQYALFRMDRSDDDSGRKSQDDLKVQAKRKAIVFGITDLPDALREVKTFRIQSALDGTGRTLGGSILALLVRGKDDVLIQIADAQSDFLVFIAEVIDLRGHGGDTQRLSKFDVGRLRRKTHQSIKTILDITERD